MNAIIYARFSSHAQNEQSIEGQLKVCYEYARKNGITVIGEYIDRALTGTTDRRPMFLKMIEDSKKQAFQYVLVYQLDRFARNRYDSATNKAKLKKNGVRVISVMENISDDASGVLMEAVLEGMAEYYSAELSQKVTRGMALNAEKCLYTGGPAPALGFKVNPDKTLSIDIDAANIVRKIFEMYSRGVTVKEIIDYLNGRRIFTSRGNPYNKNSLHHLLKNKRYIGIYTYKGTETPNGLPRIISDELFYEVQERMAKNEKAPARSRAVEEYLLTTKLFCGYCHEMMTGVSGTSMTGQKYFYYVCNGAKKKLCGKKAVRKNWIEDLVIKKCREILTDENIEIIARACTAIRENDDSAAEIKYLQKLLKENDKAVDNLFKALETGAVVEQITARIQDKNNERAQIEKQLAEAELNNDVPSIDEIRFFLHQLKDNKADDLKTRKALIAVFVNSIYLFDDKITFILNVGNAPVEITEKLLEDIEQSTDSSCLDKIGSPKKLKSNPFPLGNGFDFIIFGLS